jgi:hypothetical protein
MGNDCIGHTPINNTNILRLGCEHCNVDIEVIYSQITLVQIDPSYDLIAITVSRSNFIWLQN